MKKNLFFNLLILVTIAEGIAVFIITMAFPTNTENPVAFGFSMSRLILLLFILFCIFGILITYLRRSTLQELLSTRFNTDRLNRVITAVAITAFLLLWVTLFTPTKNLSEYEGLFVRSKPFLIWLELMLLQAALWIKISNRSFTTSAKNTFFDSKRVAVIFLPILLLWVFISTTKVGLVQDIRFWNVPGIPLNMLQFLGILWFLSLGLIFSPTSDKAPKTWSKAMLIFIPLGIYLAAVLIWGFTPMLKHFFSLLPTPPNLQPFPYSDARYNDLGGLSVLLGKGIYFYENTDKPLYMVFLAILHVFSGNNYNLMQWAQIFVLALTPVALYFFAKKQFGTLFGILAAGMLVIQQRNAIILSHKIASVNPKLLMSEMLTLLGIILVTWLLFHWMRTPEPTKIFLLGGLIAALSLVRVNPVFIAPVLVLIILLKFRKTPKLLWKQILFFSLSFILVFSSWIFTGVNSEGVPWFFIKIRSVIETRYNSQNQPIPSPGPKQEYASISPRIYPSPQKTNALISLKESDRLGSETNTDNVTWVMFNHFLHNFSTSILTLPDAIAIYSLSDLSAREYWQDNNEWNGNFPPGQYLLILANLFIISLGIAYAWRHYRWAGMAPAIIFLAYDLSLAAATNSGSRYIVPINWIVLFYYGLGLMQIAKLLLGFLGIRTSSELKQIPVSNIEVSRTPFRSWLPSLATLLILAFILPFANLVVPKLIPPVEINAQLFDYARSIEPAEYQLINGTIFYPYYQEDGNISFEFLAEKLIYGLRVPVSSLVSPDMTVLESGMRVILSVTEKDGKMEIRSIYLQE